LSGVDQSVVSRFEYGLRPKISGTAVARMLVVVGLCPAEWPPGSGLIRTGVDLRQLDEAAEDAWGRERLAEVLGLEPGGNPYREWIESLLADVDR
jgi:hypothetical protein